MSTIVQDITTGIETRIAAVWTGSAILDYVLDVSKNNFDNANDRYGVRPLEAVTVAGVTRYYTLEQNFEIILTKEFINDHGDSKQREVSYVLYDKMDDVFKDLFQTKIGLSSTVLNVGDLTLLDPEYLKTTAIIKGVVTVTYRKAV